MCTVVFIPTKDKYLFASLRDENPLRQKALIPAVIERNENKFLAPIDPEGGGTWAGVNQYGHVIILLNGGIRNHIKSDNYERSRGEIVTELLSDDMPLIAWYMTNLENIEPFTLIMWTNEKLFQLIWDGKQKHRINLAKHQSHIFSSATLYDNNAGNIRKTLFKKWMIQNAEITGSGLFDFFSNAFIDKQNAFIIDRGGQIKTLSYTVIEIDAKKKAALYYDDLFTERSYFSIIELKEKENTCLNTFNA